MISAGCPRSTIDLDLVVAADPENDAKVNRALEVLPDKAVRELPPGDLAAFTVVRVCDEIVVDLMASAGGLDYGDLSKDFVVRKLQGDAIPFASPRMLWRMQENTHRQKDAPDLPFPREHCAARIFGQAP